MRVFCTKQKNYLSKREAESFERFSSFENLKFFPNSVEFGKTLLPVIVQTSCGLQHFSPTKKKTNEMVQNYVNFLKLSPSKEESFLCRKRK